MWLAIFLRQLSLTRCCLRVRIWGGSPLVSASRLTALTLGVQLCRLRKEGKDGKTRKTRKRRFIVVLVVVVVLLLVVVLRRRRRWRACSLSTYPTDAASLFTSRVPTRKLVGTERGPSVNEYRLHTRDWRVLLRLPQVYPTYRVSYGKLLELN